MTFQLYRPVVVAELSLKPGGWVFNGRQAYRFHQAERNGHLIKVKMQQKRFNLRLRGDKSNVAEEDIILFNSATEEYAVMQSPLSLYEGEQQISFRKFDADGNPSSEENTDRFLKGARLYILKRQEAGIIEIPYEIPEVVVTK